MNVNPAHGHIHREKNSKSSHYDHISSTEHVCLSVCCIKKLAVNISLIFCIWQILPREKCTHQIQNRIWDEKHDFMRIMHGKTI